MKTSIVLGLLFGDEGKGLTTSCLCEENDLVIRFCGGHQAGHTVEKDNYRHVFSSFGSGTLNEAHTYWSEYCTFYPKAFYKERKVLIDNGFNPIHYIHPLSMVTTPFDINHNRQTEKDNKHGSVGVGFGATIKRHTETPYKLFVIDLKYKPILIHKLWEIANYYGIENPKTEIDNFINYVDAIELNICQLSAIKNNYSNIIFEGAQGIMLDMDFGFFPNVTRSNTTSKNAMQIIKENNLPTPEIYYCMRSYLTRHGNGWMPNEHEYGFEDNTNKAHEYQGQFRQGSHSLELIKHALSCDNIYSNDCKKNIVITCLNQTDNDILLDGKSIHQYEFKNLFNRYNFYTSNSKTKLQNKQLNSEQELAVENKN